MFDTYQVNFDKIIHHKQKATSFHDIISKAYAAGFITKYGEVIIYGTGAERGTFSQFAVVKVEGVTFFNARENITWFTNIFSKALRNQGKTKKKKTFYLSQQQEIKPLIEFFGLSTEYYDKWHEIKQHDIANDLPHEWQTKGYIHDWKNRSICHTIALAKREMTIMNEIALNLCKPQYHSIIDEVGFPKYESTIQEAFIEGLRGLTLTLDDIQMIERGKSIIEQYKTPTPKTEKICA